LEVLPAQSSAVPQAVAAEQLSGLGSVRQPAQLLARKASGAETDIIIGEMAVTWNGRTAHGFGFHLAIAVRKSMMSPRHRSQATLLHIVCSAFDRMIPRAKPISGTTGCAILARSKEIARARSAATSIEFGCFAAA
jgi:hypothetical protein